AGSVEIAPLGRLNVASSEGFAGTVTGEGLVGFADNAVLDFGDGASPLLSVEHPVALGTNVTVNATVRRGRHLIARGTSFVGAENLETWTASLPGDRKYRFVLARQGKDLYLVVSTGFEMHLR
ncbi:MAG: hypothetical protein J5727_01350, partial [Kiritimatiellae bacterium]|nr:hypothetical protein [Kiritimatiellia bacterium]